MKKLISRTILFILFTSLFYISFLFFYGRYAPTMLKPNINYRIGSVGHLYSRLSEIKDYKNVDVLFLGSSHAYRGFDPRIFLDNGYKSFNLGSSAQTPTQTKVLLKRYLEILNPNVIVYEVYPEIFNMDGVESSLDIIANDRNDFNSLNMALKINNIKTYNTLIFGYTNDLLGLNNSFSEPTVKGKDKYISGGYVETEINFNKPTKFKKKEISFNYSQLECFSEIVKIVKNKNIELMLVYAPIPSISYKSYTNNHYFDSLMKRYSKYYNFNEIIVLNDSLHFYDNNHLNQNGVKIFNEKLIKLLNQNKARTRNIEYKK